MHIVHKTKSKAIEQNRRERQGVGGRWDREKVWEQWWVGLRARRGTHLPEPDLRSYQISFNWTECHLQIGGALVGH